MQPGTKLGPYEITGKLGAGGMGEVYRATDTRLGRSVAIKVLPEHFSSDPRRRERFEREARTVSSLNHPHICTLHDVGEQDGRYYLVMELIEGETLEARVAKGRLPLEEAVEYAIQIAGALEKAHGQGVVHRDLKPANIMITSSGVKLLDFGLAKLSGDSGPVSGLSQALTQESLTAEGTIPGTLRYMAPEQLEGKDADARSDIFACGAVVYEMVTGRKAFAGESPASVIGAIMNAEPPPMTRLEAITPPSLEGLVQRCLAKDPERRWQTAADLVRELRGTLGAAAGASSGVRVGTTALARRRVPAVVASIGLLVAVLAIVGYERHVPTRAGTGEVQPESIAVLPFRNQSPDRSDEYFADGLADELLTALSKIPELKVASRTASFYYKGRENEVSTAAIAATLMVDNVLSGSVRRDGNRIRVTVALDDPKAGNLLWSTTYDRSIEDILDIQRDIAERVTAAVVPVLSPESAGRIRTLPTENGEAYSLYLRGRDYLRQPMDETALPIAVTLFERAIELDPRFAHAFAGLCEAELSRFNLLHSTEHFERAEMACHRAVTLDDRLWETRVALGKLYRVNGQYDRAIAELEGTIAQQPNIVSPYLTLAGAYQDKGLVAQAETTLRRAEEIEPGSWEVHNTLGNLLYEHARYDEAILLFMRVTELAPDSDIGYNNLGNLYLALGRLDEALQALNTVPHHTRYTYANRGLVHYYRDEFAEAVDDFTQAIQLAPDYYKNWGRLGDANRFIGGAEEDARKAYETAIRLGRQELTINPSDWQTLGRLGTYYAHTHEPKQARDLIGRMLGLTSDAEAYYYASLVHAQLGDVDRAANDLEKTITGGWTRALLATDPDLRRLRGDARIAALLGAQVENPPRRP